MRFSRRHFLRTLASLSVASAGISLAGPDKKHKVLVVGAGASGLAAAYELSQAGHDVLVFEARSRIGGRMHTLHEPFDDGLYAEAGALFLISTNPGLEYAREFGLEQVPIAFRTDLGSVAHVAGVRVIQPPASTPDWPVALPEDDEGLTVGQLQSKYHRNYFSGLDGMSRMLEDGYPQQEFLYLDKMTLAEFWKRNGASDPTIQLMRLRYFDGYGDGIESVSTLQLAREAASFTGMTGAYRIQGGNDRICFELARRLPNPVQLSSPVVAIAQDANGVRVSVEEPRGRQEVTADFAIVTAPLQVQSRISFTPALSPLRAEAIREIAGTDVCRVYVQTRSRYWEEDALDGSAITDLPVGLVTHATAGQEGERGILESFTYGNRARQMASLSDADRLAATIKGMGAAYPGIEDQVEQHTSYDWGGDPWARGGHCAFAPGQVEKYFRALGEPEGRVFFAGDAIGGVPGYSHAAFQSGIDIARRIDSA